MKIRDQLVLIAALFGVMLLVIAASVVTTTAELDRLDRQVQTADRIGLAANDLNYLSSEYLLYGEPQQLDRWERRYAGLEADLANLSAGSPEQQALIAALGEDRSRLRSVFDDIRAQDPTPPHAPADPATLRVSWSRVGVQTQGLAYDAGRLAALLRDEAEGLRFVNTLLVSALLGTFAAALLVNYLMVGRRTLRSLSTVLEGAAIVGSGDLAHEIPVESDDEVGELSRAFNRMAADLATVTASRADLQREMADRTRAEAALHESEEKYRNLVELSPDAILIHRDGTIVFANRAAAALVGVAGPEDLVGRPVLALVHPETRDRVEANIETDLQGEESPVTTLELLRDDGTPVPVQGRGALIPFGGRPAVQVALRDVTEEKRAEEALREYTENLRRSNEDLERFAYVSSHDLQEPLRSIVSFSQLLERRYRGRLGEDADEYIAFIVEGGTRMQALIQDLLAYSRVNTKQQELRPIDTEEVLAAVERNLDVPLREAGAVLTLDPMPVVLADPLQLEQVLMNLVSNAIKFRRPDDPLRVRIGARRLDGFWEFSVADNGIGIETEYFDRIFVIFQRLHTKETYPGTGIGLAIVKRIIDRHGGTVRVESTPGEGTTFFFTLPDESFDGGATRPATDASRPPG